MSTLTSVRINRSVESGKSTEIPNLVDRPTTLGLGGFIARHGKAQICDTEVHKTSEISKVE